MHELSICSTLLRQVAGVAAANNADHVRRIVLAIGPLAGVEAELLERAFLVSRAGTIAETAMLDVERTPLRVRCRRCGAASEVSINRLVCAACGDWQVDLLSGDELQLMSIDIDVGDARDGTPVPAASGIAAGLGSG